MMLTARTLRDSWQSWLVNDERARGPYWLQLVWTLLFCLSAALGFTVLGFVSFGSGEGAWRNIAGWWHWYRINLVVSLVIGFLIHGLFELGMALVGHARLRATKGWRRTLFYSGIPIVGVLVGWPIGAALVSERSGFQFSAGTANLVVGMLLISVFITVVLYQFFASKARQTQAERRATEAQLQLLQAQIEPHFLFNTLANVLSLIDHDAPRAKLMLETFSDYLRASLGELRGDQSTVGAELDMAEVYLRLLQLRMDDRLSFRIVASAAARQVKLPPLLLQPLVENAITHGLEPKVEGGTVSIHAALDGEQLSLRVEDDGLGVGAPLPCNGAGSQARAGGGLALENIRQRLASRFGDAASLQLQTLTPGTRATITLPSI